MILLGAGILYTLDNVVPPLWLFLGASRYDSFVTFFVLRETWRKNGLTLLDRAGRDGAKFYDVWRKAIRSPPILYDPSTPRVWSLRTRDDMWESTVLILMDFVPVVIVDVRGESEIVRAELDSLKVRGFANKAWYVASGERSVSPQELADVIKRYPRIDASMHSRVVTEVMLEEASWSRSGIEVPHAFPKKLPER